MFRQGQLAVHGLAILLGRNEAGISNRGKFFCTTLYYCIWVLEHRMVVGLSDAHVAMICKRGLTGQLVSITNDTECAARDPRNGGKSG